MRTIFGGFLLASAATIFSGCEVEQPPAPQVSTHVEKVKANRTVQGDLQFVRGFQNGYDAAVTTSKPMLIFFTAEWCEFCYQMGRDAFTNPATVRLSDQFICILVDRDKELEVCKQYGVQSFPTIQFLSPRGVLLNRLEGKNSGQQVIMAMQQALQSVARRAEQQAGEAILR
jgi:thioredoxin-related protein